MVISKRDEKKIHEAAKACFGTVLSIEYNILGWTAAVQWPSYSRTCIGSTPKVLISDIKYHGSSALNRANRKAP